MTTRPLRRGVAAAAMGAAGFLIAAPGPAAGQSTCYPPTPGCAGPAVIVNKRVENTNVVQVPSGTASGTGSLARTGAMVVPVALVGVGLVAAGFVLKRSSRRETGTTG